MSATPPIKVNPANITNIIAIEIPDLMHLVNDRYDALVLANGIMKKYSHKTNFIKVIKNVDSYIVLYDEPVDEPRKIQNAEYGIIIHYK